MGLVACFTFYSVMETYVCSENSLKIQIVNQAEQLIMLSKDVVLQVCE